MQISELLVSNSFGASDVLAIEINGVTYKLTGATLAAALKAIGALLAASDVVNNLSGTATDKPLSAAQGKALNDALGALVAVTTSAGLTGATGVTINNQVKLSIGKLRVYEIVFTTNASIAADTNLVTGFDTQMLGANGVALVGPLFNNGAHNDPRVGYLTTGNALCCTTAFGSGDMRRCTVIYIAQ